jgi:hypothetical protein
MSDFLLSAARRLIFAATIATSMIAVSMIWGASAAPAVTNVPIYLMDASFYDGGTITGTFSLNVLGFANAIFDINLGAATSVNGLDSIPAVTLSNTNGAHLGVMMGSNGTPDTIEILSNGAGNTPPLFFLTFEHSLTIGGADPFVISADVFSAAPGSAECDGFSCTASNEVIVATGFAEVIEPTSLVVMVSGLSGLLVARRRRKLSGAAT